MANYVNSGEYDLSRLTLITNTSSPVEIDLKTCFIDITIFESIYDNMISGAISVIDTTNMREQYALGNFERIEIDFATTGVSTINKIRAIVYKVGEPTDNSEHSSSYLINFASEEMINNMKTKVYNGYNGLCSMIAGSVYDMVKRATDAKPIDIEETRNIEKIVFAGFSPMKCINKMADRSVSSAAGRYGYLFYEDMDKFNFKAIESLYEQEPVTEYYYRSANIYEDVSNRTEEMFNAFQDFVYLPRTAPSEQMQDGQFGSSWNTVSLTDRDSFNIDFNISQGTGPTLGKSSMQTGADVLNTSNSDRVSVNYSLTNQPNREAMVRNKMALYKAEAVAISIGAFGDSTLRVGKVIKATVPKYASGSLNPTNEQADTLSGKFLIAEIKHILTQDNYTQRIKIIKDSFEEKIA